MVMPVQGTASGGRDNNALMAFGACTATDEEWSWTVNDQNGVGTRDSHRRYFNDRFIAIMDTNNESMQYSAEFVSFDDNGGGDYGFTINILDTDGADNDVFFIALGGDDLEDVIAYTGQTDSTLSGTPPLTEDFVFPIGHQFQPTSAIFAGVGYDTLTTHANDLHVQFGMTDFTTEFTMGCAGDNGTSASATDDVNHIAKDDHVFGRLNVDGGTPWDTQNPYANSNGFGWEVPDVAPNNYYFGAICFKVSGNYAGDFDTRTSTGDITSENTALGFSADVVFAMSDCSTAYNQQVNYHIMFGWTDAVNEGYCTGITADDGGSGGNTETGRTKQETYLIETINENNSMQGIVELKTINATGLTFEQTNGDSSTKKIQYLALGGGTTTVQRRHSVLDGARRGVGRGIF